MKLNQIVALLTILAFCSLPAASRQQSAPQPAGLPFSTPEQIKEDINAVTCKDKERLNSVKILFEKMGVPAADITVEKIKGVENVVVRKAGKSSDEKIIIGAHYDKTGDGSCGAVDNWTGVVAVANIYKTLKDMNLNKTILFVAFGNEEKGLLGSKAMASQIKKDMVMQYCGMINIDSLGLNTPQILTNVSSKKLEALAADLAKKMTIPYQPITIHNASSDSASFMEKKIPAATVSGIPNDWMEIFHSKNDQVDKINVNSVYLGYRLALAMLVNVDEKECGDYREK